MPAGKVGRPARIDRTAIAEAVLDLGLDGISMKAVADHLGVSVAGLYHHVGNRRELLVLAAEHSLSRVATPEDTGQHWDEWLREWARHVYRSFVEEPEILVQFMNGGLRWDAMGDVVDSVIRVLGRAGFDPIEAMTAFDTVAQCAVGAAVQEIRGRAATERGAFAPLRAAPDGRRPPTGRTGRPPRAARPAAHPDGAGLRGPSDDGPRRARGAAGRGLEARRRTGRALPGLGGRRPGAAPTRQA